MSFDVNIGRSQPVIKATANMNNDGGSGGNTGYMMSGRRKDDKKNKSLFSSDMSGDSFEMASKLPVDDIEYPNEGSWLDRIINKIKK